MLIQIHIIQNYSPSNLNRDDTGAPKDAIFGGFRRGRISSQCLKRSMRRSEAFLAAFEKDGLLGTRTRLLPQLVGEDLKEIGAKDTEIEAITRRVNELGHKAKKDGDSEDENKNEPKDGDAATKGDATRQLIFIGKNEIRKLTEQLLALYREKGDKNWAKVELEKELVGSLPLSVDIALFGRMTTSAAFEDVQAACQVAHALSTHAIEQEFDYYTAVDDLTADTGAGMIGDIEFNSATYYKYLNVHWEGLVDNLGGDKTIACQTVLALLEAAVTAHPSGKQNSFAAHNLPELVLVEISEKNLPVSYANTFLKPVRSSYENSLAHASVIRLGEYIEKATNTYNLEFERAFVSMDAYEFAGAKEVPSLSGLKGWLSERLPE